MQAPNVCLQSKDIFHQRLSSICAQLPSKIVHFQRLSTNKAVFHLVLEYGASLRGQRMQTMNSDLCSSEIWKVQLSLVWHSWAPACFSSVVGEAIKKIGKLTEFWSIKKLNFFRFVGNTEVNMFWSIWVNFKQRNCSEI